MLYLKSFAFNAFQENTYVVYDDKNNAIIFDPGNSNTSENLVLKQFIADNQLNLTRLILTHAHLDHVLGNKFIQDTYGLLPEVNAEDLFLLENMMNTANMYGVPAEESPMPEKYISEGDQIILGDYTFDCIHAPGHSPGSICFYNEPNKIIIVGDVLFRGSIGRTDLPGGNHQQLLDAIQSKLFTLPDDVKVFNGHGPSTTIGFEKNNNPFF
ncbi:MAG: MBL fold metallo-hydrolase [Sphingobacteriaceae bacterium]|nr:MBL fold metallo-hydrolase [Sphingobacteriaceae bacterium]